MKARIYQPVRTAMQSGEARAHDWVLEFEPEAAAFIEPLMGWTGGTDTAQQLRLTFSNEQEAVDYAKHNRLEYTLSEPKVKIIKPKSYAANFAFNRMV